MIRFNAFQMNAASHQSPGLWKHPRDQSFRYTDPDHWLGRSWCAPIRRSRPWPT